MPFLGDGAAERIVKVEANGIPVGALDLVDPSVQFYSLTIKAAANTAPSLKLHFSLSPAPSDGRLPEIGLARLALVPIKLPVESSSCGESGDRNESGVTHIKINLSESKRSVPALHHYHEIRRPSATANASRWVCRFLTEPFLHCQLFVLAQFPLSYESRDISWRTRDTH